MATRHTGAGKFCDVTARPLAQLVHPSWSAALAPLEPTVTALGAFLREEVASGRGYLPAGEQVLRAFGQPLDAVRVLIVGQDPYPTPGHPVGLSFSVAPEVRPLPPSLVNIFSELGTDLGLPRPSTGDLTPGPSVGCCCSTECSPSGPASRAATGATGGRT